MRATLILVALLALASCEAIRPSMKTTATEEGFVDAGAGVRLGYRKVGSGTETIIVLHGGPGFTMDYLADDLAPLAAKHTVIFYDQRGTGRSTLVTDAAALDAQRFAEDLEAVRRHFGLPKLTLLGHSWGAGVAALYATRYPDRVGRLIIVGGIPLTQAALAQTFRQIRGGGDEAWRKELKATSEAWRNDPGSATACRAFYETWFARFYGDRSAASRSKGDFCAGGADSLRNKIASVDRYTLASLGDYDWRSSLKTMQASALIIHGTVDAIPPEHASEWAATLPNARLLMLQGVGHFPYLEVPETFFTAVERFMQGEWPDAARTMTQAR